MTAATQSEFARIMGVAKSRITALKNAGRLVMTDDGLVDVEASQRRIAETASGSRPDVAARFAGQRAGAAPEPPPVVDGIPTRAESEAKTAYYTALQKEIEHQKMIGELTPTDDMWRVVGDITVAFCQALENLPHRVAADLVGKDLDAIRSTLKEAAVGLVDEIRREAKRRLDESMAGAE